MDTPEQETLDRAANEWIAKCESNPKYPGGHYPLVIDTFIAGAEWERERAKVLVEALEFYAAPIEGKINSSDIDRDFYDVKEEDFMWTGGKKARQALAKYRGGG